MISSKLLLTILPLVLTVLAILPYIKGDQRWYYAPDLSAEESETHSQISHQTFGGFQRSDDQNNGTDVVSFDLSDQSNYQNRSNDSISEYSGRSAKMLNFDDLLNGKSELNSFQGNREGRIINEKDSNLAIKGFIPIVGFGKDKHDSEEESDKPEENSELQHYLSQSYPQGLYNGNSHHSNSPQHIPRPEDQRFIGAALQGLAASLSANPIRKQGFGNDPNNFGLNPNDGCVCVPFYMCKNGYLTETAKNSAQKPPNIETAQSIINQFSAPLQTLRPQQQQKYQNSNQFDYLPIDERSNDDLKITNSHNYYSSNNSAPQYADDVFARMLGVRSDGCGVLRTCCRPPIPEADFSLGGYQFPGSFPNGPIHIPEHSEFNKRLTNSLQPNIQQLHDYIKPQRPHKYENPYGNTYQRPVEAYPTQIVQASYGFPTKQSINPINNYGGIPSRPLIPQIPIPIKPEYQPTKPVYQRPVPVYPGYKPHHSAHSLDSVGSNHLAYGTCGIRQAVGIHGRVQNLNYHESSTEFGEYPWQVAILKRLGPADSLYVCGGILISPLFIATAAHCVKKFHTQDLKVRLGEWDVHREDEFYPYVEKYIEDIIIHPEFFAGNLLNDIALIKMESHIDFNHNPHIAPICLPELYENFAGHRCFVSGWGKNSFGHQGEFQSVLTKVDVPVLSHGECEHALKKTRLGYNYQLHPSMVCAGGEPGKDACEGDGGSGMVCDVRGIWKVAGLVSWGVGCGQPGVPGVYTNMAYLKPWIDSIVLRFNSGPIGSIGSINPVYGAINERSFAKTKNSTEIEDKENREESEDSVTTTTSSSF